MEGERRRVEGMSRICLEHMPQPSCWRARFRSRGGVCASCCDCPSLLCEWGLVRFCIIRIVKLLSRRPFLSPENAKRFSRGSQEDMNFDGTPVKAPSASRRMIMPPTPQQSPQPPLEGTPRQVEVEDQEFGACGKDFEGEHRLDGTRQNGDCPDGAVPERE